MDIALSFSLSTGTSTKDFFKVVRKVWPGGYAEVAMIECLRVELKGCVESESEEDVELVLGTLATKSSCSSTKHVTLSAKIKLTTQSSHLVTIPLTAGTGRCLSLSEVSPRVNGIAITT